MNISSKFLSGMCRLKDDMMEKIYSTLPEAMVPLMNQSLRYNPAKFHERNESIDVEFG